MHVLSDESAARPASTSGSDERSPRGGPAIWRIALVIFIISSVLWLGGSHIRAIIGNDLLTFGTLEIKDINLDAELEIYRLISLASLSIMGSYCVALVSSIVFLWTSPFRLKEHGWLMISAILFYLFVPVEVFTMYLDGKMIYNEFFTTVDNEALRGLFLDRLGALAGTPFIATLCYYTIIILAVFQPLKRKQPVVHEA